MVDWSWIISQITFWRSPINRSQDGGDQDRGEEEDPGSSGVDRDAEGPIVGGGEVLGGGHLGETSHGERPKYSRHHLLLVSIFHVCIGLWVVMGLGLVGTLGGWVGFPDWKADHRMVGRCLGRVAGWFRC